LRQGSLPDGAGGRHVAPGVAVGMVDGDLVAVADGGAGVPAQVTPTPTVRW
jgi:hypothetical protein